MLRWAHNHQQFDQTKQSGSHTVHAVNHETDLAIAVLQYRSFRPVGELLVDTVMKIRLAFSVSISEPIRRSRVWTASSGQR